MDEVQPAEQTIKRRRKSKSRSKTAVTWPVYFRSPQFGRHLFVGMALVSAAYVGMFLWDTRLSSFHYNSVTLGDPESEVRYMLGQPDSIDRDARVYRYAEKGRNVTVAFTPDWRASSMRCEAGDPPPASCPDNPIGIGMGDTEFQVLERLGVPSRETYSGNDKTMHYDGMGVSFDLRLYRVRGIAVRRGEGLSGYLPRALWAMIP